MIDPLTQVWIKHFRIFPGIMDGLDELDSFRVEIVVVPFATGVERTEVYHCEAFELDSIREAVAAIDGWLEAMKRVFRVAYPKEPSEQPRGEIIRLPN